MAAPVRERDHLASLLAVQHDWRVDDGAGKKLLAFHFV
jgi:hypothetical protein